MRAEKTDGAVIHEIPPVWDKDSGCLLLGTFPSPKSREAGFFYMHPQNRFWPVIFGVFGEELSFPNGSPDRKEAIEERKDFLLRRHVALWDVLAGCRIHGAEDSTIREERPNDFSLILGESRIRHVFCTGKAAFALWKKHCAALYEEKFALSVRCLPSTSPANARYRTGDLLREYAPVVDAARFSQQIP